MLYHTVCNKPLACELAYIEDDAVEKECVAVVQIGEYQVCQAHAAIAHEATDTDAPPAETHAAQVYLHGV